jgi:hypothetical protein
MDYDHVTVVLEDDTIAGIEVHLESGETIEDWIERAVAEKHGDGETVDDEPWDG